MTYDDYKQQRDEALTAYRLCQEDRRAALVRAERAEAALRDGCCPHCGFWVLNPALTEDRLRRFARESEGPENPAGGYIQ